MRKIYVLLTTLFLFGMIINLSAQTEYYQGADVLSDWSQWSVVLDGTDNAPGSATTGCADITATAGWQGGRVRDANTSFTFNNIDLANGVWTLDYKTSDVSMIGLVQLTVWSTSKNGFATLITDGWANYELVTDGAWHTMTLEWPTDWHQDVYDHYALTDNVNPYIHLVVANGSEISIDNLLFTPITGVAVTNISFDEDTVNIGIDSTETLAVSFTPSNATNQFLSWSNEDDAIAKAEKGIVTGIAEGGAYVYATSKDGGIMDSVWVNVLPDVAVTGITLDPQTTSVAVSSTVTLTPTIAPTNATDKSIQLWFSGDTDIATVANGIVTGVAPGMVDIVAITNDGEFRDTSVVTVTGPVTGVTLDETLILAVGAVDTLVPVISPQYATDPSISSWMTSNNGVASVTMDASGGIVTAVAEGTAEIICWTNDGSFSDTCVVTVSNTAGINDFASGVEVYPVPANDILTINNASQISLIQIMDMSGKVMISENNTEATVQVNVESLASGAYILNLSSADNKTATRRIVIE